MRFSLTATRKAGRDYHGNLSIVRADVETTDTPAAIPIYITASVEGRRDPTSHRVATSYDGTFQFDPEEVVELFRAMVEASGKSKEFKRVVRAVLREFRR